MKRGLKMDNNKTTQNKWYDIAKFLVTIFMPALITLLTGLGVLFDWADTELLTGTLALFMTFFASILQISSINYHNKKEGK